MNGGTLLALGIAYLTGAASGLWLGFKLWRQTYITGSLGGRHPPR